MSFIKAIKNDNRRPQFNSDAIPASFSLEIGKIARGFHSTFPQYNPTPLISLKNFAKHINVTDVLVKDESHRFGLKAFKILGGSYAIGKFIASKLRIAFDKVDYGYLKSGEVHSKLGDLTFCTASDGNHGRGVAFAATQLGFRAVVYLPKGTVKSRVDAIRQTGAEAIITDLNYDETVALTARLAEEKGWVLIQDTSWPGYTEIPLWIMQGYLTMLDEILEQMHEYGIAGPTHVFLQAGVGSMAAAILGGLINKYGKDYPITAVIEPNEAACFYDSVVINDGRSHAASGNLKTIMAGLSCGVPSQLAWEIMRSYADMMIACDDALAINGMRLYAHPRGDDPKIVSGESGAVSIGLLTALMKDPQYVNIKNQLNLNENSIVLLLNTEGDTDPENYRKIVNQSTK